MPLDEAVLPAIETTEVAEDTPTEQPEGEQVEASTEAAPETPDTGEKGDNRLLPGYIRALKETDPKGYREASQLFFKARTLEEKLTGVDLDKTLAYLTEQGGLDGLQGTLQEREAKAAEYDTLLERIGKGDSAVVRELAESSPQAFPQIAKSAMIEWGARDPDSYQAELSGVFAATIAQGTTMSLDGSQPSTIPDMLTEVRSILNFANRLEAQGRVAEAAQERAAVAAPLLERMQKFLGSFSQARQPMPGQSQQQRHGLDADRQAFEQEKQESFNNEVSAANDATLDADVLKELGTYIARMPDDVGKREMATENVKTAVLKALKQDKDFSKKYNQLLAQKDKAGAMKLATSRQRAIIGAIAQRVGRTIYGNPTPAKPSVPAKTTPSVRTVPPRSADKFDAVWNR